jgi:hypothetical protein
MTEPENPASFIVRTEAQKAASNNGFRLERGIENGWLRFESTTAQVGIWIARASKNGPRLLSVDRPEVSAEIGLSRAVVSSGPGVATFAFATLQALYRALDRVYRLGVSLPDAPLNAFLSAVRDLLRTTEAERLVVQRVGQDLFRQALLAYWGGRCPPTGITNAELLRASHIVPWAECDTDEKRLNVHNGLLPSALCLTTGAAVALGLNEAIKLTGLTGAHRANLAWHRSLHGFR